MKNKIEIYHASTEIISQPLCNVGRKDLDFGPGFYLTDVYDQAVMWAKRRSSERGQDAILNVYLLDREAMLKDATVKIFEDYDRDWLNFIVACRKGDSVWEKYDYIEGGVANDRVIDTVNLFINGLISEEGALRRLRFLKPNNQICILNQEIIDRHLTYIEAKKLSD